jgi:hypothetical protein
VAVDDIRFLRAFVLRQRGRVVAVRFEQVDVEEIGAVLVAAAVGQREDVLLDVGRVVRLAKALAVAPAESGIAPVGGVGGRGQQRERRQRGGMEWFRRHGRSWAVVG